MDKAVTQQVLLANGETLSDELLNMDPKELKIVVREEKIYDAEFKTEAVSYMQDVWKRFKSSKVALVATIVVAFIIIMGIIGPNINGHHYLTQNADLKYMPPRIQGLENLGIFDGTRVLEVQAANIANYEDAVVKYIDEYDLTSTTGTTAMMKIKVNMYKLNDAEDVYYWFGSDSLGRDLFSRLWQGTRVSLILAFAVVAINLSVGLVIGAICGYYGGWIDMIIQRIMDIIYNIPYLPLTILLIMLFGSGIGPLILVFCLTGWMGMANSVRMQFYRYKNREYVLASRTMGAKDRRIMFRYILPNAVGTIITAVALSVPSVIFQEASLSYLGLGVQAPNPSIGILLSDGQTALLQYPFMIVAPSIVIVSLMLAFNLFGNGLRDAFNPSLRQ